jgi:hypothetical protein
VDPVPDTVLFFLVVPGIELGPVYSPNHFIRGGEEPRDMRNRDALVIFPHGFSRRNPNTGPTECKITALFVN